MNKINNFKNLLIDHKETILKALKKLDRSNVKILFVRNKKKIIGSLSDGDLRRIILKDSNTKISIEKKFNKNFLYFFNKKFNQTLARRIMLKKDIFAAPILNNKKELVDIFILNNSKQIQNNTDVFILAGGLGKRMGPLTTYNPKPMLLLGQKPLLESIIYSFKEFGMFDFIISINYLGKKIEDHFKNGKRFEVNIKYVKETSPLGTAGPLSLLNKKKIQKKNLIVINGDIFTKLNYQNLMRFHEENKNDVTICAREYKQTVPYGVINSQYKKSKNNEIINEKPVYKFQISAGIYVFDYKVIKKIQKKNFLDMNIFLNLLSKKHKIGIFPIHEELLDMGDLKSYETLNSNYFI
jgi:dTDP-glucose pyrophosphorylase